VGIFNRKEEITKAKEMSDKLKEQGNISCMACGLPSGFRGVTLKKVGAGKYICTSCAKK
jgi:transposase-like protein